MAYALKYYHNFQSIKSYGSGSEYRLEIYLEGYGGSSSELNKIERNSIQLDRAGDLLENVLGTTLSFNLFNQTEGQFSEFRDASWGDYMVKLIFDPSSANETKFIGYNQSEIYTESYDQPPYTAKLEFTDGLSHLKHVRFDNSGTLYEGQKTIIEVLRLCLNKLPNPVKIREFVNVYEDSINSTTTDSMLNQIYVDASVYKEKENNGDDSIEAGFFCYKVIEEILKPFNAHIFQADGFWYIIRTQEYRGNTMYYREFNANVGTESTVTIDATGSFTTNNRSVTGKNGMANELILVAPSTEMSIDPPLNRVQVTYNQQNLDANAANLLKNGCFDSTSISSGRTIPDFWDINGDDWTTYNSFFTAWGDKYWQFEPVGQETQTTIDTTKYIEQSKTNIPTSTLDSLLLKFDFVMFASYQHVQGGSANNPTYFIENNLEIVWEFEIKFGTYYLDGDNINGYSWTTTASRGQLKKIGLDSMSSSGANNKVYEISTLLPTLPQSAIVDFSIKIYKPYHNIDAYFSTNPDYTWDLTYLGHRCFTLMYLPEEAPPQETQILYAKIDEDENVEEIETIHGDGTNSVTLNSFRISTGVITDSWDRRGLSDGVGILTILLRQLRDLRSQFLKNLGGMLIGELDFYNTIEENSVRYWMKDYTWTVELNEWDVELMELRNDSAKTMDVVDDSQLADFGEFGDDDGGTLPYDPGRNNLVVSPPTSIIVNQNNLNNYY